MSAPQAKQKWTRLALHGEKWPCRPRLTQGR
ncbi:hypothetical protein QFZ24_009465 [Streptomyces phaeochromogenes]|nr:hypothetical protein [Streptomyces phaeochromogenes]